jgi:hypothetical protein
MPARSRQRQFSPLSCRRRPRSGLLMHTPQGILHGANEAYRAEFQNQKKRKPSDRRARTSIGVDTYRPLNPTSEFKRLAG